jgi:predicted ArsR family transcriptional regulator
LAAGLWLACLLHHFTDVTRDEEAGRTFSKKPAVATRYSAEERHRVKMGYLGEHPRARTRELVELLETSSTTVQRDLNELMGQGLLERRGERLDPLWVCHDNGKTLATADDGLIPRQRNILGLLEGGDRITRELAESLDVTTQTIRRDMRVLGERGLAGQASGTGKPTWQFIKK